MIKFSLLMCLYEKENPLFLKQCLDSINTQTVLPDEVIIVKDGPLTDDLEEVLKGFNFSGDVNIVSLPDNMTLGPARAAGVEAARHEWVAIMDSDDICKQDRFEKQLGMIEKNPELGLIGGQISEFTGDLVNSQAARVVPLSQNDIVSFAKFRNPFNHMTVMFKREAVLNAGNYRLFPLFEDYDLWTRMINNGTICANHADTLVDARIGSSMYKRRRGLSYIKSEWRMQKQLKALGVVGFAGFIRNVALRIPVRLLPGGVLAGVYGGFARKRS